MNIYTHIKYKRNNTEMYKQGLWRPPWYLQSEMWQGGCSAGSVRSAGAVTASGRVSVPERSSELGSALLGKLCRVCGEAKAWAGISHCQATSSALCPGLAVSLRVPSPETAAQAWCQKGIKYNKNNNNNNNKLNRSTFTG